MNRLEPLIQPLQIGNLRCHAIQAGGQRLDGGAMFGVVPKPLWEKKIPADDRNRIQLGMRCLLIEHPGGLLLIDTGAGNKETAKFLDIYGIENEGEQSRTALEDGVRAAGHAPEDVVVVINTHLHFDHAGGFSARDASGAIVPRFRNARYVVNSGEWEDATHPHERNRASYFAENYVPLRDAGLVDLMPGDGEVMPGVRVRRTGGHTRCHQIVYLESGGETAVFAADLIPTTAHVDVPWIMAYDLYPMETLEFKRTFVKEAVEREYVVFFEHDPVIAAGIIRQKDRGYYVEPLT